MTIGAKIRQARKQCKLSQEQLAEVMCVSRSAIAKWETDKGLPDIENLRMLSKLLHISTDWLLEADETSRPLVYREPFDLTLYSGGCKRLRKDRFIRQKFPNAQICSLLGRKDVTHGEAISRNDSAAAETAPSCFRHVNTVGDNSDINYYLVQQEDRQFFVVVTNSYLEYRIMEPWVSSTEFTLDGMRFIRFALIA